MTINEQIIYKKNYLKSHPCKCSLIDYFSISFPYCSRGYICNNHCSLWYHFYYIDFGKYHRNDPSNSPQLELF